VWTDEATEESMERRPASRDENGSDVSSILSVPSTQVTGLTMAHTGATVRRDMTGGSEYSTTRPPSYRTDSRRVSWRSPSPESDGTGRVLRHPVMGQEWREWIDGMLRDVPSDVQRS
jgi:hypothetical protein